MRRVLRRARDGVALNVEEAALALTARGDELAQLCASAARVRDAGLASAGRRGPGGGLPISYSRKVFIPVTHLCRDTCHYCTFVTVPGKLRAAGRGMYLEPDEILDGLRGQLDFGPHGGPDGGLAHAALRWSEMVSAGNAARPAKSMRSQ